MLRLLTVAACALAVGGGFAIPHFGFATSSPSSRAAALQRLGSVASRDSNTEPVAPPDSAPRPIPARMLGPGAPVPISPSMLQERNGWLVSDGRILVAIYAGAAGDDPSVGRLVVVRQDLASGVQTVRIVDVGATGALAITAAPLGTVKQSGEIAVRTPCGRELSFGVGGGGMLTRSSRSAATVAPPKRPQSSDQVSDAPDR